MEKWIPPPDVTKPGYEKFLQQVFVKGVRENSNRTAVETEVRGQFIVGSIRRDVLIL